MHVRLGAQELHNTCGAVRGRQGELEANPDAAKVSVYPEMKRKVAGACKGNIPYFTFFPKEAVAALKLYLKERVVAYGEVPVDAPLFNTEDTKIERTQRNVNTITKDKLRKVVHQAARRAGIPRWKDVYPHVLRKAAESFFRGPTTDGVRLDVKTQEFLMGHIVPGSQDPYFDKTKVDELRERFSRLVFRQEAAFDRQKVVALGDLEKYINEGWDYVTTFNSDRAIVKLPVGRTG